MAEETPDFNVKSIFRTTILDASGQPFVVLEYHKLIWTLVNNITNAGENLVIMPFESGSVGPDQHNFKFKFIPGVFTDVPKLEGWDVAVERDIHGAIKYLYIALTTGTTPLNLPPNGGHHETELIYTSATQVDANSSLIQVWLTTGGNVNLGTGPIPNTTYGPFNLRLVQPDTPELSAPPISVDFVGRRTLLNDGKTGNSFTFAITNMTLANLPLTPSIGTATTTATKFTVWFDVVGSASDEHNAWALTTPDKLTTAPLPTPTPPSSDWRIRPIAEAKPSDVAVSPQWEITVTKAIDLQSQVPVHFTFSEIKTELDPGITRMYLRFENLSTFRPGVLIAELEKTPLQYGATRGKGLYISAGMPQGDTPPLVSHDSGLYVHQFGDNPAAIFNGGNVGIGAATRPAARLQIVDDNHRPNDAGTLMLGPGNLNEGVSLRFGCQPEYSWIQSHGSKPLAINPLGSNAGFPNNVVGIGTGQPGSALSVAGGMAVGKGFAQKPNVIADNQLAVEGRIGIGITTPGSSLSVAGGVAIGNDYAQKNTTMPVGYLAVEGRVGIGTTQPDHQLHVKSATGIKLGLEGNGGGQLFISNSTNDNSVQLVAAGRDDTPNRHTSAQMMWLGGWANPNPALPKMVLNATEVDIQAATTRVSGKVGIGGGADSQAMLAVNGDLNVGGSVMIGANKRPAPYATEKLMIIRGVIWGVNASNGLKYNIQGSGFTVRTDNNAGKWIITFEPGFSNMPTVVAMPQFYGAEGAQGFNTCYLTYMSSGFVTLRTGTIYYGEPAWCDFVFIAIGPI